MRYFIYLLIALGATTAGSATGIGGGVIIKPLLDIWGDCSVTEAGILSSITVFTMALVSTGRHLAAKTKFPRSLAVSLACGSLAGGYIGQFLFTKAVSRFSSPGSVKVIQNSVLAALILFVIIYMFVKDKLKGFKLHHIGGGIAAGCALGMISAFLGIGGGPINVAFIILLFSVSSKSAAVCSIVVILFAQAAKLVTAGFTGGFEAINFAAAPIMAAGAVAGGFIGAGLNRKLSEKAVERAFICIQFFVLSITVYNIITNII